MPKKWMKATEIYDRVENGQLVTIPVSFLYALRRDLERQSLEPSWHQLLDGDEITFSVTPLPRSEIWDKDAIPTRTPEQAETLARAPGIVGSEPNAESTNLPQPEENGEESGQGIGE